MRFHVLAVPHTVTNKQFVACAFTQKVLKFCEMMTRRGHTIIHYGHPDSEVLCTEHVNVITRETYTRIYGDYDWKVQNFKFDLRDEAYQEYNANAIREIRARQQPNDFVLAFWGQGNKAICDALGDMKIVEPGIGYSQAFAPYRIYESYALMHANLGLDRVQISCNMPWYHVVIPNYFDPRDFEFTDKKQDYFLYLGRITRAKGVDLAINVTAHIGAKLIIAGQGGPGDLNLKEWPEHVEYVGYAFAEERRELMKNAKGVFIFSTYVEPFAGVMIESFLSGTPVISTDWGTFAENNLHGVTGYRCRTFDHMVWAARNIERIDPHACLTWGQNFTLDKVAPMYEDYFQSALKGWYDVDDTRHQLDWFGRTTPIPRPKTIDAFFQCYNEVTAADKAFETYRKCYPGGNVVMINDGGDEAMKDVAFKYGAIYGYGPNIGICHWKKPTEWLERFFNAIEKLESDYFVMQEEDVWHVRPVDHSKLVWDICGTNPDARLPPILAEYTGRTHYAGSGGCFFRTAFFKRVAKTDWRKHIEKIPAEWLHADIVLSVVTYMNGGTIGYCTECVELNRPEYQTNKDPAVIHQYKVHYVYRPVTQKILWVTAFRDIKRETWPLAIRTVEEYFTYFQHLIEPIGKELVCFIDEPHAERVRKLGVRTLPYDIEDTYIPKHYPRHKELIDTRAFHHLLPEYLRDQAEYTIPDYAMTLYGKQCFIRRASDLFPEYTHYAWIDFGYARSKDDVESFSNIYKNVPNDQIYISSFRRLDFDENHEPVLGDWGSDIVGPHNWNNWLLWMRAPMWIIQGNLWFVPKKLTHWVEEQMDRSIERQHAAGLIVSHEEPLWLPIIHDFRSRFKINIKTEWRNVNWA